MREIQENSGSTGLLLKDLRTIHDLCTKHLIRISTLAVKMSGTNPLARILETNRLTGLNFKDWLRNIKIVLSFEKLSHVLDQDIPVLPDHPNARQTAAHEKWVDDNNKVRCYMLASMSNEL